MCYDSTQWSGPPHQWHSCAVPSIGGIRKLSFYGSGGEYCKDVIARYVRIAVETLPAYHSHFAVPIITILGDISLFPIYMVEVVQRVFFKVIIVGPHLTPTR